MIGGRACAAALVALLPALASAQRGGFGGRGPGNIQREDGVVIPQQVNVVNLLIEHRQDVALTDSQFVHVIALKRSLDSTNAPAMRKLDSVARLFRGGRPLFSSPSRARGDSIAEGRRLVERMVSVVKQNNADGRDRAYALLTEPQLAKAQSIAAKAEQALAEASSPDRKKP